MKPTKIILFLLAAKLVLLVSASELELFDVKDFTLPDYYDQISYKVNIHLYPELFTPKGTEFSGKVEISLIFKNVTDYVAVNSEPDRIKLNKITFDNTEIPSSSYTENNEKRILEIHLGKSVNTHVKYLLVIEYTASVATSSLDGLYKSSYVDENGAKKYLLTSQLGPANARKFFPCLDEPAYKAYFNFTVTFPSNLNVLFNTLEMRRMHNANTSMTTVQFHQTPKMSTYVLALVVSDLTCSFSDIGKIPFRICSRDEFASKRRLALDVTPKLLERLNNVTNYNYELHSIGKLDIVAVPDFPSFTMENWGLVLQRESDLLFDAVESSNEYAEKIIFSIAHALAHQWFGDLVTVNWWTENYVNEGLSTYFQYYIINEVLPDYEAEKRFVLDMLHEVLVLDAREIELFSLRLTGIATMTDIDFAFSEVSHQKGSSIIRMVQHFMSLENFKKGIQNYIHKHQFGNVDVEDLWSELDKTVEDSVSIMPANLTTVMKNWIWLSGYPLVTATVNGNTLTVSQMGFCYHEMQNESRWYVPISYTDSAHKSKFQSTTPDFWITPDSDYQTYFPPESGWLVLNNQQTGYYRVNYDSTLWEKIKAALQTENFDGIIDISRAQIVDDLFNLARADILAYSFVFDFIRFLKNEMSFYSWKAALEDIEIILRRVGESSELGTSIKTDVLNLIDKFYHSVPISNIREDDHLYTLKQMLAVEWACRLGHEKCVEDAVKLFKMYKDSGKRPTLELRYIIYCNGLRYSNDGSDWYFMWEAYMNAEDQPSEQETILKALGCSKDKTLLKIYLHKTITKNSGIKPQDTVTIFNEVKKNPEGIDVALDFLIQNQEAIVKIYQTHPSMGRDYGPIEIIFLGIALRLTTEEQISKLTEVINNGTLKKGFLEYGKRAESILSNLTSAWRAKYADDIANYYGSVQTHTSHYVYLYILLLFIPLSMLLACKYRWNRSRERFLNWVESILPTNIWNRGSYVPPTTEDIPMVEQADPAEEEQQAGQ